MKFVYDKKVGQMVPEKFVSRDNTTDIEEEVFSYLYKDRGLIKRCNYRADLVAREVIRHSPNWDLLHGKDEEVKQAVRAWYYINYRDAHIALEDAGGACGATGMGCGTAVSGVAPASGQATVDALSIPSPFVGKDEDKKKKDAKEEVNIDDIDEKYKNGNCYQVAWNTFYSNISKSPLLCHGIVVGKGPLEGLKYNHAWVEIGDTVIDNTMPVFTGGVSKQIYYELGRIEEPLVFRYTAEQVMEKAQEWMTYGPWEDKLWQYC